MFWRVLKRQKEGDRGQEIYKLGECDVCNCGWHEEQAT